MSSDNDELYTDEKFVAVNALENIELVIQTPAVVLVEYLHPHKGVESCCLQLKTLSVPCVTEDFSSSEMQDEGNGKLEYGLTNDHFPHSQGN